MLPVTISEVSIATITNPVAGRRGVQTAGGRLERGTIAEAPCRRRFCLSAFT
jgi:hypothetical protein